MSLLSYVTILNKSDLSRWVPITGLLLILGSVLGMFYGTVPAHAAGDAHFQLLSEVAYENSQRTLSENDLPGHTYNARSASSNLVARIGIESGEGWRCFLIGGMVDLEIPSFDLYHDNRGVLYGIGISKAATGVRSRRVRTQVGDWRPRPIWEARIVAMQSDDEVLTLFGREREEISWVEYSMSGGVVVPVIFFGSRMEPYVGIRTANLDGEDRLPSTGVLTFDNQDKVSLFTGVSFEVLPSLSVNLEVSALDQEAFRFSLQQGF